MFEEFQYIKFYTVYKNFYISESYIAVASDSISCYILCSIFLFCLIFQKSGDRSSLHGENPEQHSRRTYHLYPYVKIQDRSLSLLSQCPQGYKKGVQMSHAPNIANGLTQDRFRVISEVLNARLATNEIPRWEKNRVIRCIHFLLRNIWWMEIFNFSVAQIYENGKYIQNISTGLKSFIEFKCSLASFYI